MRRRQQPPPSPAFPSLPPHLASCGPYYERSRLYLRRFLAYLKPWEARSAATRGEEGEAPGPGGIDGFVVKVLLGDGYSDERATSLAWLSQALDEQARGSDAKDGTPAQRFEAIRAELDLSQEAVDLLWLLLWPELVPEFLWLYRAIWGDSGQVAAQEDFLVHVLDPFGSGQREIRALFTEASPLLAMRLVEEIDVRPSRGERFFRASQRLVEHLLGVDALPKEVAAMCRVEHPRVPLDKVAVDQEPKDNLSALLARYLQGVDWTQRDMPAPVFHLHGPEGVGKLTLATALASTHGRSLVVLDAEGWLQEQDEPLQRLLDARREAFLRRALLAIDDLQAMEEDRGARAHRRALERVLGSHPEPVFVLSTARSSLVDRLPGDVIHLQLKVPGSELREKVWHSTIRELVGPKHSALKPKDLARKYNLTPKRIRRAVQEAITGSHLRGADGVVSQRDLVTAATAQLTHDLSSVADRVEKTLDWKDLILPEDCMATLKEIVRRYRHQKRVFDDWGFRDKFSYGIGISVLFSGPPGTGKTMTAGILARELDMELFRIDLSRVVSKWIGETEKNLARVFDEGKSSHAIILFDEADSLFGKRGEVRSSVDRYSNLEVNYLLQRMENYEGISILTTNQPKSMDEAFMRRITFKVSFPFPDEKTRLRLWKSMIPPQAEVEDNLGLKILAEKFEFSGGHIKNTVLRAAFLAAEAKRPISFRLLVKAAIDEARTTGRLLRTEDLMDELEALEKEMGKDKKKKRRRSSSRKR